MKDNLTDSLENISVEETVEHDAIDINRDEKLKMFLESISKKEIDEDSEKKEAHSILKEIYYENKFRHRYSYITSIFFGYSEAEITTISSNIENIYAYICTINNNPNEADEEFINKIYKLLDHINLEVLRIKNINEFKKDFKKSQEELKIIQETTKEITKLNDEVKSSRREYITILGVFASIILAFVAGLSFSNAVLSNIDKASIYRLSFIVCLIGLFITNILHYLYKFIKDIHFNNYSNKSKDKKYKFCDSYICKFNAFITIIILCIFIVWAFETEIKHLKQYIIYYLFY